MATAFDLMSAPVYVVDPEDTVSHARMVMLKKNVSRLVVTEGDRPVGMITKSDIAAGTAQNEPPEKRRPLDNQSVSRYMTGDVINVTPYEEIGATAEKLLGEGISGLPVVEGKEEKYAEEGTLLGIITKKDIAEDFASRDSELSVRDIYSDDVKSIHRHSSLNSVVEDMMSEGIRRLVVKEDNGAPVGIITRSDLAFTDMSDTSNGIKEKRIKMTRKEEHAGEKKLRSIEEVNLVAEDVMTEDVFTVNVDADANEAARLMLEKEVTGLPVLNDDEVTGVVTETDIVERVAEGTA